MSKKVKKINQKNFYSFTEAFKIIAIKYFEEKLDNEFAKLVEKQNPSLMIDWVIKMKKSSQLKNTLIKIYKFLIELTDKDFFSLVNQNGINSYIEPSKRKIEPEKRIRLKLRLNKIDACELLTFIPKKEFNYFVKSWKRYIDSLKTKEGLIISFYKADIGYLSIFKCNEILVEKSDDIISYFQVKELLYKKFNIEKNKVNLILNSKIEDLYLLKEPDINNIDNYTCFFKEKYLTKERLLASEKINDKRDKNFTDEAEFKDCEKIQKVVLKDVCITKESFYDASREFSRRINQIFDLEGNILLCKENNFFTLFFLKSQIESLDFKELVINYKSLRYRLMIEDCELLHILKQISAKKINYDDKKRAFIFARNDDDFRENNFKNFYYSDTIIDVIKNYYKMEDDCMLTLENRLIKFISEKKKNGQKYSIIDNLDSMQEIGIEDPQRFEALIDDLELRGLIKKGNTEVSGGSSWFRLELTNDGYKRLEEIDKSQEEQKDKKGNIGRKPKFNADEAWKFFIEKILKGEFCPTKEDYAQQAYYAYRNLDEKDKNKLQYIQNNSIVKQNIKQDLLTKTGGKFGQKTTLDSKIVTPFAKKFPKN